MPQRFLRPGITTSKRFNRIDWITQSFFTRLLTLVDDYGRFEADHQLLRSLAFPLGDPSGAEIPLTTIANICQQLLSARMVLFYSADDGKEYLQLSKWQERARSESRYPDPKKEVLTTFDNKCLQMLPPSPSPSPSSSPAPASSPVVPQAAVNGVCLLELQREINVMYSRSEGSRWSHTEEHLLHEIAKREGWHGEFEEIKIWIAGVKNPMYRPQSVSRLLSDWPSALDKARLLKSKQKPKDDPDICDLDGKQWHRDSGGPKPTEFKDQGDYRAYRDAFKRWHDNLPTRA